MRDVPFEKPLTIETARVGRYLTITRVGQAADFLMNQWPGKEGSKHRKALRAVLDVLEQGRDASIARAALIAAAEDADVFVLE
ncbi:DUF982 domain-containing protein [Ollibium composti]|uniref:DUF982 domain-containing protein n=1 Tax=Ollibium composti TaxID=2675109 RepID=A0ABY2Q9Z2_9HYPH|nr:DUF982 domain-containing protein [Mesorhizobium composti]THF58710.1 DUF982 domain-containing protein [Mesorhizobium composti]